MHCEDKVDIVSAYNVVVPFIHTPIFHLELCFWSTSQKSPNIPSPFSSVLGSSTC